MHSFFIENRTRIKKSIPLIESKLKIKVLIKDNKINVTGSEFDEFLAAKVIQAVDFGFDPEDALLLKDPDYIIEYLNLKEHTRRRNLKDVRARVIGRDGRAKGTIEDLTGSIIFIRDNKIGVIATLERIEEIRQAIISLIHGSKHANVFAYLEKQNAKLKEIDKEDLGLKIKEKK